MTAAGKGYNAKGSKLLGRATDHEDSPEKPRQATHLYAGDETKQMKLQLGASLQPIKAEMPPVKQVSKKVDHAAAIASFFGSNNHTTDTSASANNNTSLYRNVKVSGAGQALLKELMSESRQDDMAYQKEKAAIFGRNF